jgi:aryl-alcohol dehydrogenase-like predicted oxidoreductase
MTSMETRKVGSLEVTVAGVGCNNFGMRLDADESRAVVEAALDAGINHFDTADGYSGGKSEQFLGAALGTHRDDVVITTKVGMRPPEGVRGGSREHVLAACDASLARLGTDRIDLYLLHRPAPDTPIGETLVAFGELIRGGKVREIGCSNVSAAHLEEAARAARELGVPGFVNVQNDYSLLHRGVEAEVLPAVERLAMTFMPFFPLASGVLTGKYARGEAPPEGTRLASWGERVGDVASDESFAVVERLDQYARAHGHTIHELALSWLAGNAVIASVIAGATSPHQVRANAAATVAWNLTPEERAEVDAIARVAGD